MFLADEMGTSPEFDIDTKGLRKPQSNLEIAANTVFGERRTQDAYRISDYIEGLGKKGYAEGFRDLASATRITLETDSLLSHLDDYEYRKRYIAESLTSIIKSLSFGGDTEDRLLELMSLIDLDGHSNMEDLKENLLVAIEGRVEDFLDEDNEDDRARLQSLKNSITAVLESVSVASPGQGVDRVRQVERLALESRDSIGGLLITGPIWYRSRQILEGEEEGDEDESTRVVISPLFESKILIAGETNEKMRKAFDALYQVGKDAHDMAEGQRNKVRFNEDVENAKKLENHYNQRSYWLLRKAVNVPCSQTNRKFCTDFIKACRLTGHFDEAKKVFMRSIEVLREDRDALKELHDLFKDEQLTPSIPFTASAATVAKSRFVDFLRKNDVKVDKERMFAWLNEQSTVEGEIIDEMLTRSSDEEKYFLLRNMGIISVQEGEMQDAGFAFVCAQDFDFAKRDIALWHNYGDVYIAVAESCREINVDRCNKSLQEALNIMITAVEYGIEDDDLVNKMYSILLEQAGGDDIEALDRFGDLLRKNGIEGARADGVLEKVAIKKCIETVEMRYRGLDLTYDEKEIEDTPTFRDLFDVTIRAVGEGDVKGVLSHGRLAIKTLEDPHKLFKSRIHSQLIAELYHVIVNKGIYRNKAQFIGEFLDFMADAGFNRTQLSNYMMGLSAGFIEKEAKASEQHDRDNNYDAIMRWKEAFKEMNGLDIDFLYESSYAHLVGEDGRIKDAHQMYGGDAYDNVKEYYEFLEHVGLSNDIVREKEMVSAFNDLMDDDDPIMV